MSVKHIGSSQEYNTFLKEDKKLVVVDFFATWCGPCKAVAGPFENLAKKYEKGAIFLKVDVDQFQDIAQQARVTAMPTFNIYRNGNLLGSVQGANIGEVENIIRNNYKEVNSFEGTGAKLGSSTGTSAPPNPFHKLFEGNKGYPEKEEDPSAVIKCEIQLRISDSPPIKATFLSNATLQEVADHVATLPEAPKNFELSTQYPSRVYRGDLLKQTLRQENLTRRGQLIVKAI